MSRPTLFTRGLSGLSQSQSADNSTMSPVTPAEQRDDAKRNFLKTMRPLPTQHYWNVYFDRYARSPFTSLSVVERGNTERRGEREREREKSG